MFCHETRQIVLSFITFLCQHYPYYCWCRFLSYLLHLLTGFLSRKYSFGVDGSANDLCMLTSLAAIPSIDRASIEPKSLITLTGCSRLILADLCCLNVTHDLSIWIWWNLKIRLNFLSLCISWHRKLEMLLKCIPMIRMISKLRKTTKNCNYKPHSHRALHVITVTALKLNTALDRCVNSNTRDASSNEIKSDSVSNPSLLAKI